MCSNGKFNVALSLPGSKSITLRDAVLASLAQGQSLLEFPADCDDFSRISEALIQLGIAMSRRDRRFDVDLWERADASVPGRCS